MSAEYYCNVCGIAVAGAGRIYRDHRFVGFVKAAELPAGPVVFRVCVTHDVDLGAPGAILRRDMFHLHRFGSCEFYRGGDVVLSDVPDKRNMQLEVYRDCVRCDCMAPVPGPVIAPNNG